MTSEDKVRVLRIIEYTGPRSLVEEQVKKSVHGERTGVGSIFRKGVGNYTPPGGPCIIRAATIGEYPEILEPAKPSCDTCPAENKEGCHICDEDK